MEIFFGLIDFTLNIDEHLVGIIDNFGLLSYAILFFVIFIETGLVVFPLLPGDSLLFAAGSFSSKGILNPLFLFLLLTLAAILGDTVNYWIGNFFGLKLFRNKKSKFFKQIYLERTQNFYDKHGGKTIVIARFIPIVRTFAPFVAGVSKMNYQHFLFYNVLGASLWVGLFVSAGYLFGSLPLVKNNFSLVIIIIILISIAPGIIEYFRLKMGQTKGVSP